MRRLLPAVLVVCAFFLGRASISTSESDAEPRQPKPKAATAVASAYAKALSDDDVCRKATKALARVIKMTRRELKQLQTDAPAK